MPRAIPLVIALLAAGGSACRDRPAPTGTGAPGESGRPAVPKVDSVGVVPLEPGWKLADFDLSPPSDASVDTPDGRLVARAEPVGAGLESRSFRIVVHSEREGARSVLKTDAANVSDLAWSPDGSLLAFCEGTLVFVSPRNGPPELLYAGPGGPYPGACARLEWSADAAQLRFIQLEHARDAGLANPARVVLKLTRGARSGAEPRRP